MAKSKQQIVDAIDEAIFAIVVQKAQEKRVTIGGQEQIFTALDLDTLRRLRDQYKSEIADENGSTFTNAEFAPFGGFSS